MASEKEYEKDFLPTRDERLDVKKRKKAAVIGVCVGVVIAATVSFLTFGRYVSVYRGVDGELPLIKADKTPFRVRPETPGGMEVPNQDKLVYERLRQGDTRLPVEKLLPSPEKPSLPERIDTTAAQKSDDPIGSLAQQVTDAVEPEVQEIASTTIVDETGESVEVMFRTTPVDLEKKAAVVEKEPVSVKKETVTVSSTVAEAAETYALQLVSTRNRETSESEWKRLSKKYKDVLGVLPHTVSEITTEKGTFFRLRAGAFATKEAASAVCEQLKQKKQECLIVKQ